MRVKVVLFTAVSVALALAAGAAPAYAAFPGQNGKTRVQQRPQMERDENGLVAASDGWFAVNVRDAAWVRSETFGAACIFEGDAVPFGQIGGWHCATAPA